MKLVVGLGNPGLQYGGTRHNAGYMVVEQLARDLGATLKQESRFNAAVGEGRLAGEKVILAEPLTYMNLSGEAVSKLLSWYKLTAKDLVVVYDDFALALGQLRVRPDGTAGGHNGIASLIQHQGGKNVFDRVRVGIGPVPPGWKTADFVLGRFSPDERKQLDETIPRACQATICVVRHGVDMAMQEYNGSKPAL
ncbi:MAG: peptidyl-tRNA hydrolase [Cyanobacteria bacterium RYN_339]|nr:peptidyl-tRNA hydrolase [Cyanobacteria bacterium RYN_339]